MTNLDQKDLLLEPKNMIITYNVRIVNSRKMLAAGLNKKLTS